MSRKQEVIEILMELTSALHKGVHVESQATGYYDRIAPLMEREFSRRNTLRRLEQYSLAIVELFAYSAPNQERHLARQRLTLVLCDDLKRIWESQEQELPHPEVMESLKRSIKENAEVWDETAGADGTTKTSKPPRKGDDTYELGSYPCPKCGFPVNDWDKACLACEQRESDFLLEQEQPKGTCPKCGGSGRDMLEDCPDCKDTGEYDSDMKPEYDFSKGKRGRILPEGKYIRQLNENTPPFIVKDERSGEERRKDDGRRGRISDRRRFGLPGVETYANRHTDRRIKDRRESMKNKKHSVPPCPGGVG